MKHYWHVHHDRLIEASENIEKRLDDIRQHKPVDEQALRLKLLKEVKGKLPQTYKQAHEQAEQAEQAYEQAEQTHEQAWQTYKQAEQAHEQARQAYEQAEQAHEQAWQAYKQARQAHEQAWQAHRVEIEDLHKLECPDCPWDGKTIFPKGKESKQ